MRASGFRSGTVNEIEEGISVTTREIRSDEHCCANPFLGVHVWEWTTEKEKVGKRKTRTVEFYRCKLCREKPTAKTNNLKTDSQIDAARKKRAS